MPSKNKISFSVKRPDLIYDFASSLSEVFRFKYGDHDSYSNNTGVRLQEAFGFDFQGETNPIVQIYPATQLLNNIPDFDATDFSIYITLEDVALGIRKVVLSKPVTEFIAVENVKINLFATDQCGFLRGYVVRCFIARSVSAKKDSSITWSKSNIISTSEFICKSSVEEALFEIAWTTFSDPKIRKNVLIYVDWKSTDVTYSPHSECFQVKANNDLKPQFKRLENNSHFGEFSIRMIADRIIAELAEATLRCADLNGEPAAGSLHEKIDSFFDTISLDFKLLAKRYQEGDSMDQLGIMTEINRDIQSEHKIASTLSDIKFGGYRAK